MVMPRELCSLLTSTPFCLPTNLGAAVVYVRAVVTGQPVNNAPLLRTEQASIDSLFNCHKHYFLSMQNIKHACFTALDAIINYAFKASNDPNTRGWHAGMRVIDILDQLSSTYGQPTPSAIEANDHIFRSPTSATDAPEVFFCRIEECAEKALLGKKTLHQQTADHQHDPPPPHHGFVYPCVRGLGPTGRTREDVDQTPQDDPGGISM